MKSMLLSLMRRFLKPEVVNDKRGNELLLIDVADKGKQLPLNKMNVDAEVPKLLKKISNNEKQRIEKLKCMQYAYIKMTEYLQETLALDSGFLADMVCLHPLKGKDAAAVNRISRIAQCTRTCDRGA